MGRGTPTSFIARSGALGALIVAFTLGLAACQTSETVTSIDTNEGDAPFESWLAKPDGDGPFAAVVLLHGCTGTERNTPYRTVWRGLNRHAKLLNENGYVTLIVDSFGPRGIVQSCKGEYASDQLADAYSAFDHLASLPFVDGDRIGLLGLSMGGSTALRVAAAVHGRVGTDYAAAVAYYPYCFDYLYSFDVPVMILIGADDDWTPARLCRAIASRDPDRVELTVYPDTYHSFDLPIAGTYVLEMPPGELHTVAGNPEARRDSQARMLRFFEAHLAPVR